MLKRNIEIKVRFTKEELKELDYKVSLTMYSREEFMRRCIRQSMFKESPPNEFPEFIRLLRKLNSAAYEIMTQLKSMGSADNLDMRKLIDETYEFQRKVYSVFLPYE